MYILSISPNPLLISFHGASQREPKPNFSNLQKKLGNKKIPFTLNLCFVSLFSLKVAILPVAGENIRHHLFSC